MDKFFWEPNLEEKTFMVHQMYKDDGVSFQDVIDIIENFKNQPLDFFGALRACAYDKQILCAPSPACCTCSCAYVLYYSGRAEPDAERQCASDLVRPPCVLYEGVLTRACDDHVQSFESASGVARLYTSARCGCAACSGVHAKRAATSKHGSEPAQQAGEARPRQVVTRECQDAL